MGNDLVSPEKATALAQIEQVLINGDLSKLRPEERVSYYKDVCQTMGLNPLTKPFDYITLNGRLTLYARKDATDQLRSLKKVSIQVVSREAIGDVYVVTARARTPDGREDESTGAVTVTGLKGDSLANAYMKAETKAKRRVTLSICGLGFLDETEVDSIPGAQKGLAVIPEQPAAGDGHPEVGYRITFGQFKDRTLEEVESAKPGALADYVNYLEREAKKAGKPMRPQVVEFIEHVDAYLGALENSDFESEPAT